MVTGTHTMELAQKPAPLPTGDKPGGGKGGRG
jgi:hypothetical protein